MTNYSGQFLISMPALNDQFFGRSVVYVCEHNEKGAMGFVINKLIDEFDIQELYTQLNIPLDEHLVSPEIALVQGGPVQQDRGFVIHPADEVWRSTIEYTPGIAVTTSIDILEAIGRGEGPERALLCLGYAGWGEGQLDDEIKQNMWLTSDIANDIFFKVPFGKRWQRAAESFGVNVETIVNVAGHA